MIRGLDLTDESEQVSVPIRRSNTPKLGPRNQATADGMGPPKRRVWMQPAVARYSRGLRSWFSRPCLCRPLRELDKGTPCDCVPLLLCSH